MNFLNTDLLSVKNIAIVAAVVFFLMFCHSKMKKPKKEKA